MSRTIDETPCDPSVAFRFADGSTARTLGELIARIEAVPGLAEHHRHHFQHWIRDILRAPDLAAEVEAASHLAGGAHAGALLRTLRSRAAPRKVVPQPGRWRGAAR